MHRDSHVINIVRLTAEVNSSWFPDLGDQPITVNYRLKKSERAAEATAGRVITVISMQHDLRAYNNEMLVIHCLCFIIRASNDEKKNEVNQARDIYEGIKALNGS